MSTPAAPPVVAVVGATAAGKSELALDLAERFGGEVVNTDAMQTYRGMDIGTAKLPVEQRRGITHHLLDLWPVSHRASVAEFQQLAREVIAQCHRREVIPILVGGSALYTRAILDDLEIPPTDPEVRARWQSELDRIGSAALHAELARRDPEAAEAIEPLNGRRVVRALEVIELTGAPFTARIPEPRDHYPAAIQIGVDIDRELLDARIATRVEAMWAAGLVAEVRGLGAELADSETASRAIGYAQVLAHLRGEISEDEALERTISATRRFVRRQDAWFRKDARVHWLGHDRPDRVTQAAALLATATGSGA